MFTNTKKCSRKSILKRGSVPIKPIEEQLAQALIWCIENFDDNYFYMFSGASLKYIRKGKFANATFDAFKIGKKLLLSRDIISKQGCYRRSAGNVKTIVWSVEPIKLKNFTPIETRYHLICVLTKLMCMSSDKKVHPFHIVNLYNCRCALVERFHLEDERSAFIGSVTVADAAASRS